jgi:hypothetical protein
LAQETAEKILGRGSQVFAHRYSKNAEWGGLQA